MIKNVIKTLSVKDLTYEEINDIIELIRKGTGEYTYLKDFYSKSTIEKYLKKINNNNGGMWQGIFLKKELIGQLFAIIEHQTIFIRLISYNSNYNNTEIIDRLIRSAIRKIKNQKEEKFKFVCVFIDKKNLFLIKILAKSGFRKYGALPLREGRKYMLIFGKFIFDYNWKLIRCPIKLAPLIFKDIQENKIKRLLSLSTYNPVISSDDILDEISIKILHNKLIKKYILLYSKRPVATFKEYNRFWYDFNLFHDCSPNLKTKIVNNINKKFNNFDAVDSLLFPVDVDDIDLQILLLKSNFIYYGYIPFYNAGKDQILLGKSKITNLVVKEID